MAEIGEIIDGKYTILKKIGQGGMSIVYLAKDYRVDKLWAVKEVRKFSNNKNSEVVAQSLLAEAKLIKRLDHQALPHIIDVVEDGSTIYLVMDYIEGKPLDLVLEEKGAQSQEIVINWAMQLCGVLNYLHNQKPSIIYRDMKPANIMIMPEGNIKVIDFGIAREYKEDNLADTISLGTKGYAAPEQFGGNGQTDARTDIYCLGVTLYHLITGKNPSEPPYEMYPIRKWNPELSAGFEKIIQKCTQPNPEDRYQNCAEMMYALKHYKETDIADKRKKIIKIQATVSMLILSILFAIVGIKINSSIKNFTLYAFILSGMSFVVTLIFSIKFKITNIIQNLCVRKVNKTKKQSIEEQKEVTTVSYENETSLLSYESGTTLLANENSTALLSEENGATLLVNNNETTLLPNDNETTLLDTDKNVIQSGCRSDILVDNVDNHIYQETSILDTSNEEQLCRYTTTNDDINSRLKNGNSSTKKTRKQQVNIEEFEIIESLTLVNTKEVIA